MSKKTILFNMPAKDGPRPEDQPWQDIPAHEERAPVFSPPAKREGEAASPTQSDQWVEHRDPDRAADHTSIMLATSFSAPPATKSVTIDVTAERSLQEVLALTLLIPPMLGWFWLYNVMNKFAIRGVH
jgi:hypothetical protein